MLLRILPRFIFFKKFQSDIIVKNLNSLFFYFQTENHQKNKQWRSIITKQGLVCATHRPVMFSTFSASGLSKASGLKAFQERLQCFFSAQESQQVFCSLIITKSLKISYVYLYACFFYTNFLNII